MCSIEPGELIDMVKRENIIISDVCRKCNAIGSHVLLREKDIYCNLCFLSYVTHKFRSTIGKSKQIKSQDKVLICYSGGKNSAALLNLIREGLDESSHKKLRFDPSFIFVNDLTFYSSDSSIDICQHVFKLNFPCYHVSFEEVFSSSKLKIFKYGESEFCTSSTSTVKQSYVEAFQSLISKLRNSTTTYEDLLMQMKNELICRCAKQLGFKKVFLGDNGTNLSVRILSDIALGRGSQMPGHVHFKTTHFDVEVFRPMRELLEEEIDYYVAINNICVPFRRKFENDVIDSSSSIISCTKIFVLGLQKEFPATVSTIFKTGDKLIAGNFDLNARTSISEISNVSSLSNLSYTSDLISLEQKNLCIFCGFIKDTNQGTPSALEAVKISKLMSSLQPPTSIFSKINAYWEESRSKDIEKFGDLRITEEASQHFCYGCRKIFKELDSVDCLPPRVLGDFNEIQQTMSQSVLIKDFLL